MSQARSLRLAAVTLSIPAALAVAGLAGATPVDPPMLGPIPVDFILFAATLAGIALFHRHTLPIAVGGLAVISLWKIAFSPLAEGAGLSGWIDHLGSEWVMLSNLLGLLLGFALLSKHFEASRVPDWLPVLLPADWRGGFILLLMIFVLSSFLDNIAGALIGGTMAAALFQRKVHIGYLAAIVAAANAGGSGSVVGDTTTTMMWVGGVNPLKLLAAYIAAGTAMLVFGVPAAIQQQRYSPLRRDPPKGVPIDWVSVFIVGLILVAATAVDIVVHGRYREIADRFPFIATAVWVALLVCVPLRRPAWEELPNAIKGSIFLLSLVLAASMMPVQKLPEPSWQVALGLGFLSAAFDNIPLTELALKQGGYDWAYLAYAVGFGGSMLWLGSSAGVALSSTYPEVRNAIAWVRGGWHVTVAYVVGFAVLLMVQGWSAPSAMEPSAVFPGDLEFPVPPHEVPARADRDPLLRHPAPTVPLAHPMAFDANVAIAVPAPTATAARRWRQGRTERKSQQQRGNPHEHFDTPAA